MAAPTLTDDQGNPTSSGDNFFDKNPPPATDPAWSDSINALYQKYLGRNALPDDAIKWQNGTYGATDLAGIEAQIKGSGEAQAYAAKQGGTGGGASSGLGWIDDALKTAQSTDDPAYWRDVISKDPKVAAGDASAIAYWKDRIARGDGALAVRNGTVQKFQDSGSTGSGSSAGLAGASGGAAPGSLQAYGVPTTPYQSQPWTGGDWKQPPLPSVLQTPYVPPTWTGGQFTSPGAFVAPTVGDALRTGNTYDPAKLPHFARGVQDFSGGQAVVGEQGPETVTLPPGSSVTPNATPEQQQALANIPQGTYQNWQANQQRQQQQQQANAYAQAAGGGLAKQGFNEDGSPYQPAQGTAQAAGSGAAGSAAAPAWGSFYAPSQIDEQNDPGYQARLDLDQQARQRSAAAQGSVLSGGTQLALGRAAQDYASNEYQNVYNRALSARQQNVGEYQNQFNNALGAQGQNFNQALAGYQANYGNYLGQANLDLLGRQQNQNEYLNNQVNPSLTSYQNQYAQYLQGQQQGLNDYLTNYGINRTGVQDFFNQNNAVANRGLSAALGTRYTG